MNSVKLWEELVNKGEQVIDNRIYPSNRIKIKLKDFTRDILYLERQQDGNVTVNYTNPKYYGRLTA